MAPQTQKSAAATVAATAAAGPYPEQPMRPGTSHLNPEIPMTYVYREISYHLDSDGIQFFFRSPLPPQPTNGRSIESIVNDYRGTGPMGETLLDVKRSHPWVAAPLAWVDHFLSSRSLTPLDLKLVEPRYIIIRLHPGWKWRFKPDDIAVWHKPHETEDQSDFYGGLRHVPKDGTQPTIKCPADCDMIYFVANPPIQKPTDPYRHSFNFRVRLEQQPRVIDPNTKPPTIETRLLDVVLDPDIRNPDGTPS